MIYDRGTVPDRGVVVVRPDRKSRLHNDADPTGEAATFGMPEWKWLRLIAMVEYLADVYGTEGIARGDDGRIVGTLPRPIKHGTRGGYLAHLRRRIPPCRDCSQANTADFLARRKRAI